ncbi:transposase family protein [Telmatocola sphagniphila]
MQDLFPQEAGLVVTDFALTPDLLVLALKTTYPSLQYTYCGQLTYRIHSHYQRVLADLPWQARRVLLRIELRKFRCMNAACPRQIFCERLPHVFASHARITDRLKALQKQIGLALGGRLGTRLTGSYSSRPPFTSSQRQSRLLSHSPCSRSGRFCIPKRPKLRHHLGRFRKASRSRLTAGSGG